ncbi:hypothetical protein [Enterobacter roggenkampii]|uniref:hypothetical protein n=1 Tax=Enterobacter roggenkampii TaxID=1812935 RepID=UPI00232B4025|nr:hypothetical protein [Enterobacter roggenkampii]WCF41244.1 hypothetical protein KK030_04075 [Enterobacter roggenkampii]
MLLFDRFNEVITHASIFSTELSGVIRICSTMNATDNLIYAAREGANKQVISSQADSLIKISRIWADFFPANTSNQPI